MEMTMDMKIKSIDKMIEMRNQLRTIQKNLGMWGGYDTCNAILIQSHSDFFEIAKAVGVTVNASGNLKFDGNDLWDIEVSFIYKNTYFNTYISKDEYRQYKDEFFGGVNVFCRNRTRNRKKN